MGRSNVGHAAIREKVSRETTPIDIDSSIYGEVPPVLRFSKDIGFERVPLDELLTATQSCAATDPRDKIFALLGIAKGIDGLPLPRADYTKLVNEIFTEATAYCIRSTGTFPAS